MNSAFFYPYNFKNSKVLPMYSRKRKKPALLITRVAVFIFGWKASF